MNDIYFEKLESNKFNRDFLKGQIRSKGWKQKEVAELWGYEPQYLRALLSRGNIKGWLVYAINGLPDKSK